MTGLSVVVEADGGARGNPGPAGYGAVVREAGTGAVLLERMGAIGVATNNVAEYSGLIAGLTAAAELGASEVEVRMDSKLVVEQMAGRWKIKHPGLRPLAAQAATLVRRFAVVRFVWVPRDRNKHADALANAAMDGASGPEEPSPSSGMSPSPGTASSDGRPPSPRTSPLSVPSAPPPRSATSAPSAPSWSPPPVGDTATGGATRLILVRHGETAMTAERRYSGRGDVPLSERGAAQARAAAGRVADLDAAVAVVLTSPLARCVRTAQLIASSLGHSVAVRPDDDLVECDFGAWEGLTFAEVRERYADEMAEWFASTTVAPPGGEAFAAVAVRVRRLVTRVLMEYPRQSVVVVSHVSPIKLILRDALAAGDAFLHRCYLDPAGVSVVDSWPDGGVAVRSVNDTAHLAGVDARLTGTRSR